MHINKEDTVEVSFMIFTPLDMSRMPELCGCSNVQTPFQNEMIKGPNIEMLLPYIDRHPLTYLVSPSTGVNSKKINPWSFF